MYFRILHGNTKSIAEIVESSRGGHREAWSLVTPYLHDYKKWKARSRGVRDNFKPKLKALGLN